MSWSLDYTKISIIIFLDRKALDLHALLKQLLPRPKAGHKYVSVHRCISAAVNMSASTFFRGAFFELFLLRAMQSVSPPCIMKYMRSLAID